MIELPGIAVSIIIPLTTDDLDRTYYSTRGELAGSLAEIFPCVAIAGLETGIQVNSLPDVSLTAAVFLSLIASEDLFGVRLAHAQCTLN
jgi:hypothetical protein